MCVYIGSSIDYSKLSFSVKCIIKYRHGNVEFNYITRKDEVVMCYNLSSQMKKKILVNEKNVWRIVEWSKRLFPRKEPFVFTQVGNIRYAKSRAWLSYQCTGMRAHMWVRERTAMHCLFTWKYMEQKSFPFLLGVQHKESGRSWSVFFHALRIAADKVCPSLTNTVFIAPRISPTCKSEWVRYALSFKPHAKRALDLNPCIQKLLIYQKSWISQWI